MSKYQHILRQLISALDELNVILSPIADYNWIEYNSPTHRRLKEWIQKYPEAMGFYIFKMVRHEIEICQPDDEIVPSEINSVFSECDDQELVEYAREAAGLPCNGNTSFTYFEKCAMQVKKTRQELRYGVYNPTVFAKIVKVGSQAAKDGCRDFKNWAERVYNDNPVATLEQLSSIYKAIRLKHPDWNMTDDAGINAVIKDGITVT